MFEFLTYFYEKFLFVILIQQNSEMFEQNERPNRKYVHQI